MEGPETGVVPPEAHPLLAQLRGRMADDAQYAVVSHALRRMLQPDVHQRASIEEVLAADLFSGCSELLGGTDSWAVMQLSY